MPYQELTNYLEKGQTRVKGTITQWNALGLGLGALTGHLLARGLGLGGSPLITLVVVCAALGFALSIRYHGIAIPKRIALLCLWLVQSQAGYTVSSSHGANLNQRQRSHDVIVAVRRASSGRNFLPKPRDT